MRKSRELVPSPQHRESLFDRRSRHELDAEIEGVQSEIIRLVEELAALKQERGDNDVKTGAALLTPEEIAMIERED